MATEDYLRPPPSGAVEAEITANGGVFDQRTLMTGLARQFGRATGRGGALRQAIDDKIGGEPDFTQLDQLAEPHARGAVLVAAVFEAFLTIYQRRSADLMRLVAVDPGAGRALHPDLVGGCTTRPQAASSRATAIPRASAPRSPPGGRGCRSSTRIRTPAGDGSS